MTDRELEQLLMDLESDRVERKEAPTDGDKIRQAICAFANDMPDHRLPGVIFIGARDKDGSPTGLAVTDEILRNLASMRDDGNILPMPAMTVQKRTLRGSEMAVIKVQPADAPPVRFKGMVWIRVGPRRATATTQEERILNEKRRARDLPYDLHPVQGATVGDLDLDLFRREYLPAAIAPEVLAENHRSVEQQLASLRFVTADTPPVPTVTGLLVTGSSPVDFVPGAYVQFLRIDGQSLADPIADSKEVHGPLPQVLRRLDEIMEANIRTALDITSAAREIRRPDYPLPALQQLVRNALMHRDYQGSNAPVRLTWFADRIEIQNPGGPFGQVTRENFGQPGITDYRNPHIAESLRNLGYVQRFGVGIQMARKALADNGNRAPDFDPRENHILVTVVKV